MSHFLIHTDGGARGNPGPAGLGVFITDEAGKVLMRHSRYLGETTNNQAEYRAIIDALHHAKDLGGEQLSFYLDSELAVKQLNGEYRVKNPGLASLFVEIHNLRLGFRNVTFTHVRREFNKDADRLVNEAIDGHLQSGR